MKKLLAFFLLFNACSLDISATQQAFVDEVYKQNWYLADDSGIITSKKAMFTIDGSIPHTTTPYNTLFPQQLAAYIIDEAISPKKVYYRFVYEFNGETLTLYRGIFLSTAVGTPTLAWAKFQNYTNLSSLTIPQQREWLINTFSKENMDLTQKNSVFALK